MANGSPGDWRHGGGGQRRPTSAPTSRRSWQPGAPAEPKKAGGKKSRVGRFLLAGVGVGVLVGLIVLVIGLIRPPRFPSLLVVAPSAPASLAVPDNTPGANAAATLAEFANAGKDRPHLAAPPADLTTGDAWAAKLNSSSSGGWAWFSRPSPVVLYFTAHGGADRDGPYLWMVQPGDPTPSDSHKLRVKTILDRLAGLPKEQPKLLVFDATRVPVSWPHGMIFNDFARALKELEPEIAKIEGLVVVCSSDEDQRSWVSEDWRESAFGYFFREGLKGGGSKPGDRLNAAALFDYVADQTARWALANRDEKQTPILLPKDSGKDRAAKVELAAIPPGEYKPPAVADSPNAQTELEAAWKTAWELANRNPPPDTLDPLRWREYLALLARWVELARIGGDAHAVKGRVEVLAGQLREIVGKGEPVCAAVAAPAGRVFGLTPAELEPADFRLLWTPPTGSNHDEQWSRIRSRPGASEQSSLVAVARMVVERVKDDPSPESLRTADAVLAAVGNRRQLPAEAHFVRMLARYLDTRRDADLIRTAIDLRRYAEEVAWVGGAKPGDHPYSEQVFRWTRERVEAGDDARGRGQDLLFDSDPKAKSWDDARSFFAIARGHYDAARDDARTVAAALAVRDRVFARLPYYARWAAGSHGKLTPADVEALLARVEVAAKEAHAIAGVTRDVPPAGDERAARLKTLAGHTRTATEAFDSLVKAFEAAAAGLTNEPHPSNWRALNNALSVPFLPANERVRLFRHARDVAHVLATTSEQRGGAAAPAVDARDRAKRQGRMALAVLGETSPELQQLVLQPEQGAWWRSYREAGHRIGRLYQQLPEKVREATAKAAAPTPIAEAGPPLTRSAELARLVDPAAPLRPTDEPPPAAEQRYWRHALLLWQAKRTVTEGWAGVGSRSSAPEWYCRKVADQLVATAEEEVIGPDPKDRMPPAELDRRLALCKAERARPVVELELKATADVDVADDPSWPFSFEIARRAPGPVGFPVYWLKPPGEPYAKPDPDIPLRHAERGLADGGKPAVRSPVVKFKPAARPGEQAPPGELLTTVFYRGHLYEKPTRVLLAGTPTLDWNYNPPARDGRAAFMVLADKGAVAGAVTILIDLSGSMSENLPGNGPKKIEATFDALEAVLRELPRNSTLTVAFFWGDTARPHVEPLPEATKLLWRGEEQQVAEVMGNTVKGARSRKPFGNTPLARSVEAVLGTEKRTYWPEAASGIRTLIVLTDGDDNWDKEKAGAVIRDRLLDPNADIDTEFHIIFFGLDAATKKVTEQQYAALADKAAFERAGRTPPFLWDANDLKSLTERMKAAVLPRVYYRREETAGVRQFGRLKVTLPTEQTYKATPPLAPGVYDLWGLRNLQRLQLDPGDRVLLEARAGGEKFDLAVPPTGFRVAKALGRPAESAGDPKIGGTHLAVQEVRPTERTGSYDLRLTATMDPLADAPEQLLKAPRPLFAWFDVEYADGKPAAAGLFPTLRVGNRPGLLAPAWDLRLLRWDRNLTRDENRLPKVTGYWVAELPSVAAKHVVDLKSLDASGDGPVRPTVERVEKGDASGLPPGDYLTVRMSYPSRAERVFVRPGKLKGTAQRLVLHERHLYFDGPERGDRPGRYTARFGPLDPADLETRVELEVYPVSAFQEQAAKTGRRVRVTVPRVEEVVLPGRLELDPARE
jgi:hypothetical protein